MNYHGLEKDNDMSLLHQLAPLRTRKSQRILQMDQHPSTQDAENTLSGMSVIVQWIYLFLTVFPTTLPDTEKLWIVVWKKSY